MKINSNFILKEIAGSNMVIPVGNELIDLNAMITLNESGAFLWNLLLNDSTEYELITAMLKEYDVDIKTATEDIREFVENLRKIGALDE